MLIIKDHEEQYLARLKPVEVCTQREFFDWQVERLVSLKLAGYGAEGGLWKNIPKSGLFIFVPAPPEKMDFNALMALVCLNGRKGSSFINPKHHEDLVPNHRVPSILADVEDGRGRLNVAPSISRANIVREARCPFTTWEGIIHVILFPEVLNHHYLHMVRSRYRDDDTTNLFLHGGTPSLSSGWDYNTPPPLRERWGAPSYGNIIVS